MISVAVARRCRTVGAILALRLCLVGHSRLLRTNLGHSVSGLWGGLSSRPEENGPDKPCHQVQEEDLLSVSKTRWVCIVPCVGYFLPQHNLKQNSSVLCDFFRKWSIGLGGSFKKGCVLFEKLQNKYQYQYPFTLNHQLGQTYLAQLHHAIYCLGWSCWGYFLFALINTAVLICSP